MTQHPEWLDWDLIVSDHVYRRMPLRGFNEPDLRIMVADATEFRPSHEEGRFLLHSRLSGQQWRVVVEPEPEALRLVVVTAWRA